MKRYILENNLQDSGKRFIATVSGANMNFSRLRFVSERSELGQKTEVLLMVEIPEQPGAFLRLIRKIFPRGISEFSYRYSDQTNAHIFLSFLLEGNQSPQTATNGPIPPPVAATAFPKRSTGPVTNSSTPTRVPSPIDLSRSQSSNHADMASIVREAELTSILASINNDGMKATDISNNEMAKSHARYMIGGKGHGVTNERLFQFTFPERPGSLLQFLEGFNQGWNISLFNYRNNGGDTANVLVGIQVNPEDYSEFERYLDTLQYTYIEETNNEAYLRFMK
jgi:threonine dehydratase